MPFDPEAPLPGAPDPWAPSDTPDIRPGPPYATQEMIAAEPALCGRLLERLASDPTVADLARRLREADAVVITGCGTSLHAAEAIAEMLTEVGRRADAVQALEVMRRDHGASLVIGISHEGGTWATNEALASSRQRGHRTALITVSSRSPGAALANLVVATAEQDQSWCHTVGYLSPLLVGAWLAASLADTAPDPDAVVDWFRRPTLVDTSSLAACDRLLIVGAGIDLTSARECALKVEEGAQLPATALHLETVRHGHLAAATDRTGLVLIRTDAGAPAGPIRDRTDAVLRSAGILGMPTVVLEPAALGPAGLTPTAVSALGPVIGLQRLAVDLALARDRNPDPIGRIDPRQRAAAEA